jgi:hypothetical protein
MFSISAGWGLYLVLAVHLAPTVMSFAVVFWLRKVPVGPEFSPVAIMAGLEPNGLALIQGAAVLGGAAEPGLA